MAKNGSVKHTTLKPKLSVKTLDLKLRVSFHPGASSPSADRVSPITS
jgi:hypothetical protein